MVAKKTSKAKEQSISNDEQVGFHKGSLMTLTKERDELVRILTIVEQLTQMHAAALKELGVDLQQAVPESQKAPPKKKPPIEDLL